MYKRDDVNDKDVYYGDYMYEFKGDWEDGDAIYLNTEPFAKCIVPTFIQYEKNWVNPYNNLDGTLPPYENSDGVTYVNNGTTYPAQARWNGSSVKIELIGSGSSFDNQPNTIYSGTVPSGETPIKVVNFLY